MRKCNVRLQQKLKKIIIYSTFLFSIQLLIIFLMIHFRNRNLSFSVFLFPDLARSTVNGAPKIFSGDIYDKEQRTLIPVPNCLLCNNYI